MPVVVGSSPAPKPEPPTPAQPPPPASHPVSPLTQEQFLSIIRWLLAVIGPILVTRGTMTDEVWQQVVGIIIALAPLIWSMITKTRSGIIATAAALPEVHKIIATSEIADGTLRADPKVVSK